MRITLEHQLQEELAEGASDGDFPVKQLRKQIAVNRMGKSFRELYVTGSVKPKLKPVKNVDKDMEAGRSV